MSLWAVVFKTIPWGDVVAAAPTVVRGARGLWKRVRDGQDDTSSDVATGTPGRPGALERQVAELRNDMAATSEVIRQLAEQNDRLVTTLQAMRARTRVLLAFCGVVSCTALVLAAWVAFR